MTISKILAGVTAALLLFTGTALADPPPANDAARVAQLQARRDRLQGMLTRLGDADGMTRDDARDLLSAYGEFYQEARRGDFNIGEAGFGLGTGAAGSLLAGEGLGLAGGLWGLAIATYLGIIYDGLYNSALIDMAIDNTAMYGYLVDVVHYRRNPAVEDRILTWFDDHAGLLERVTGERPPRRHQQSFLGLDFLARDQYDTTEVRDYLRRHSVRLLFFLGMLEETHGGRAFPQYIFASTDPVLRRNGYRAILRPILERELRTVIQEIDRVLAASRPTRTSSVTPPAPPAGPSDVASVVALAGGGTTGPAAATADGAPGTGGSSVPLHADTNGGVTADASTRAADGAGILRD